MERPKRVIAATEIKNRFGDYLGEVIHKKGPVLIERHGKPAAVIVEFDQWKRLREEKNESSPWFESLKELVERIDRNHPDVKPFSAVDLVRQIREEEG